MKKLLYLPLLLLLSSNGSAQVTFQKAFGGIYFDHGRSVQQTTDGGYIITGLKKKSNSVDIDISLIKTNSLGDTIWCRNYGGANDDRGIDVKQTFDGGYIVACYSTSISSNYDAIILKTDAAGNLAWTKLISLDIAELSLSILQSSDGGYVLSGAAQDISGTSYDMFLIKMDSAGIVQWSRAFTGSNNDLGYSITQTSDGGFILTGFTYSFGIGNEDVIVIKTDSSGNLQWTKTYGGQYADRGYDIKQTTDGGYIIAAWTLSFTNPNAAVYLIKTDSVGNVGWSKIYGNAYNNSGTKYNVYQMNDGGYSIGAMVYHSCLLFHTDSLGNLLWTKNYKGTGSYNDLNYMSPTNDGGYVITGFTNSFGAGDYDIYFIKTDNLGNSGCFDTIPSLSVATPPTQYMSPSLQVLFPNVTDSLVVFNESNGITVTDICLFVGINPATNSQNDILIYPNPFQSELSVSGTNSSGIIELFDISGKKVTEQKSSEKETFLNVANLSQGFYQLRYKEKNKQVFRKVLKQ